MAPEQAAADPQADHRVDLYALGVIAYEAPTGAHPFAGRPAQAVLAAHATEAPEPITRRRASIRPALAALVMRPLEKHPADRPQHGRSQADRALYPHYLELSEYRMSTSSTNSAVSMFCP
jgi:serine/threonine protein kinase